MGCSISYYGLRWYNFTHEEEDCNRMETRNTENYQEESVSKGSTRAFVASSCLSNKFPGKDVIGAKHGARPCKCYDWGTSVRGKPCCLPGLSPAWPFMGNSLLRQGGAGMEALDIRNSVEIESLNHTELFLLVQPCVCNQFWQVGLGVTLCDWFEQFCPEVTLVTNLGRLAWKWPLVTNLGRLTQKQPPSDHFG